MKKGKILIVDDEKTNIDILKQELQKNYAVYFATNPLNAFDILDRIPIDLILLDIVMPEINGFEFFNRLLDNEAWNDIRVIYITGETNTDTIVKGFELGAVDYISKPFELPEVTARVKNHMDLIFAKQELEAAKENLEILNSTKDRLFSIIGHDLRNPVGGIKSFLELILHKDSYDTETTKHVFSVLYESSSQAYKLLEELLVWAKAQKGEVAFNPQDVDLSPIISHLFSFFKEHAEKQGIDLITTVNSPVICSCDADMIKSVLRNLIANAIKFTHAGGSVTVSAQANTNNEVEIRVVDTGMGIPKEHITRLFDKKSYITTTDAQNKKGTGLGLAICYDFIEKHGGSIWVESTEGKGSCFICTLPQKNER